MFVSLSILAGVAWGMLATQVLRVTFPEPTEPPEASFLPVDDFRAVEHGRKLRDFHGLERIVDPSLAEMVYAALVARAAKRQIVVVGSHWGLRVAATEALTCVQAPIQALEMAFPGVRWVPSRRVKEPVRVLGADVRPFELPPERRKFIGALLARTPGRRERTLELLRRIPGTAAEEDRAPGGAPTRRRRCWFGSLGDDRAADDDGADAWVRRAAEARAEAYDAEATVDELLAALAASVRAAGGEVVVDVSIPPEARTSPSVRLPARGSVVEVSELDRAHPPGRVIAAAHGRPQVCALLTRQGLDRDPGVSLYSSEQHSTVASRALASATGKPVRAMSRVRMGDALAEAARAVWGPRSDGDAFRRMCVVEASEL